MKQRRRIVLTTKDYRLTIVDHHYSTIIERRDGYDAMGFKRWRELKGEEYQAAFFDFAGDVAVALMSRKKRKRGGK